MVDQAETPYGGASNGVGVGAAAVVLLIAFGSLLAMGLPIATALMGIGSGLALIALLGHVFPAPSFSAIVAAMIGQPGSRGGATGLAWLPPGAGRRGRSRAFGRHP